MSGGGSKAQTVGYRYRMGLHLGFAYGPVDSFLEFRAGGRTAWAGNQTASGTITINAPTLFGGDDREGGIVGDADVMMGEASQGANAYLSGVQVGAQPGYRGMCGLVYKGGLVASMNPYLKPISVKLRRITQGWRTAVFYSARAGVSVGAGITGMNPAHIVYQCLTDPDWGLGYPTSSIDSASFTAAADVFFNEGFGLCMQFTGSAPVESFLQTICDHAGAVLGIDRVSGLFLLSAIRGGYSVPALPLFNDDNILQLDSFQRRALSETVNEVVVTYRDPITNKDGSVTAHDLANITSQGGPISQSKSYPGLPTSALASRVAVRDVTASAAMLAKVRFKVNRTAYALRPGSVLRFSWPKLGIVDMPLRVGRIDYGTLIDGVITIDALEDVFGLPATTYISQQPAGWTPPSTAPVAPAAQTMIEAPYREIFRATDPANLSALTADACFVAGLAARPVATVAVAFDLETKVGSATYAQRERAPLAPYGTITAGVSRTATSIVLGGLTDAALLTVGEVAMLGSEMVRVDSIAGLTIGIARGCLDTVPAVHSTGATFWGLQDRSGDDATQYVTGEVVDGRFRTVSTGGVLATGASPVASVTTGQRFGRPYPPGDMQINAVRYPATIVGTLTVSWVHRTRTGQADTIIDTLAATTGPEAGTTYTLELYDETGVLRRTYSGIAGTSQVWTTEIADSLLTRLNDQVRVRLWSVRSSLDSFQRYDFTFTR